MDEMLSSPAVVPEVNSAVVAVFVPVAPGVVDVEDCVLMVSSSVSMHRLMNSGSNVFA